MGDHLVIFTIISKIGKIDTNHSEILLLYHKKYLLLY